MNSPNIKTKVLHSQSKDAWNVVGTGLSGKYKIARIPYVLCGNDFIDTKQKAEALHHAEFISHCFNNSDIICNENRKQ